MQLVFHTGAHFTEEDRLIKCLLRNKDAFHEEGIAVPGPGRYRKLLRDTVVAMENAPVAPDAREVLFDAILEGGQPDRVLLSLPHFFGAPRAALRKGQLYPNGADRMAQIARLFNVDEVTLCMGVRNPATFLPLAFSASPRETAEHFTDGVDPRRIRWSDTFLRIREAAPEIPVIVWCNEDAPLIWSQVVREMAALDHGAAVTGGFDLFEDIMQPDGVTRFNDYMSKHPDMTEIQIRRVMVAFLDKYARDEAIEETLDMPGWTHELVDELTELYDEDMLTIARIPGVEVISP